MSELVSSDTEEKGHVESVPAASGGPQALVEGVGALSLSGNTLGLDQLVVLENHLLEYIYDYIIR